MKFPIDCYPCLSRLVLKTRDVAGLTDTETSQVMEFVLREILANKENLNPPILTGNMYEYIRNEFPQFKTAEFDPYKIIKKETTQEVLQFYPLLKEKVKGSDTPFDEALKVAAAGNIIDFGAADHLTFELAREMDEIDNLDFAVYHFEYLKQKLNHAEHLLYILDNAGETVFDRVLIEYLAEAYPKLNIVIAAREKAILNDATLSDAAMAGLDTCGTLISSGTYYPGTVIGETDERFHKLFHEADVIISKGQGNYETMCDIEKNSIFFILRVKCLSVAKHIGTDIGKLVMINPQHSVEN